MKAYLKSLRFTAAIPSCEVADSWPHLSPASGMWKEAGKGPPLLLTPPILPASSFSIRVPSSQEHLACNAAQAITLHLPRGMPRGQKQSGITLGNNLSKPLYACLLAILS